MADKYGRSGRRWKAVQQQAYRRDKARNAPCWICGGAIDYAAPPRTPDAYEPDHYIPAKQLYESGHPELVYDLANLRPSHCSCNRSRGAKGNDINIGQPSRQWL